MARASDPIPALVQAAQDLEDELRRCEEAVADGARLRLTTEKNIGRAARALKTAGEHREGLAPKVNALLAAIRGAQTRAETAAARMETRAGEIRSRLEQLQAIQTRAGDIAAAVRDITEVARQAKDPREILERLGPIEERVDGALQEARKDDFDDVVHDIAAFREALAAMRRKLEGR